MKESTIQSLRQGFRLQSKERIYEIVSVLGSGSFGITYLATAKVAIGNISTTVKFAIKEHFISASCYRGDDGATVLTVPTAKSEVSDSRADFIIEANRLQKLCLKSRNIVSVNETFEANGTAYYVMEFLDGGNPSRCSEEKAISIVMQVADALNEIHKERVLHLDLKPDNIVLKTNDKNETYPVLIDFGISKHFDSKGRPTSSLNAKGASSGFAPQEQYAGVSEFSPKYDIYALGAVLFFLCTGKNPPDAFKVSPNQQELKKELEGNVSSAVKKAILNAMKPAAFERTPSTKQFCDDLMGVAFVPVLSISESYVKFRKDKDTASVPVDSNISWSVYSKEDWCVVKKNNNSIVISVAENKGVGERSCNVVVEGISYQISHTMHIKQEGVGTVVLPSNPTLWERYRKKIYQAGGIFIIGLLCILIGYHIVGLSDTENESKRLTEAIADMDGTVLEEFAKDDSIRAYFPYAQYLVNIEKFDDAIPYAKKAMKTSDSISAIALLDSIDIRKKKEAEVKTAEQPSQNAQNKNDQLNGHESVVPESNYNNANEQPIRVPSNDDLFAKATTIKDLTILARKGYKKAYAPLAELYLKKYDYDNAHIWAVKAGKAKVGLDKARAVVKVLDSYGYYENSEHGGKPDF